MTVLFYWILINLQISGTVYVFNKKLVGLKALVDLLMSFLLWPSILFIKFLLKYFRKPNEK